MDGNQAASARNAIAIGIHIIRGSMAFLGDNPVAITGAMDFAPRTNAIKTSHTQPLEGRGWKILVEGITVL